MAALLLAAPLILPLPVPLDFARERLAAAAAGTLGRDVRIGGARLTTGLTPTLALTGLEVAGAPALAARAEHIEAEFLLLPLLAGELRVLAVRAEGVATELKPSSWPRSAPAQPAAAALRITGPRLISLRRAAATLHLDALAQPLRISVDEAEAAVTPAGGTRLVARGALQALPSRLTLESAALGELLRDGARLPFDAALELPDAQVSAAGAWDRARFELAATIAARAQRPEELARAFGVELAPPGAFGLRAQLAAGPGRVAAEGLQIDLGQSRIAGSAAYAAGGERPVVTVDLRGPVVDLQPFFRDDRQAGATPENRVAAALTWPRQADVQMDLRVERLLTPLAEARDAVVDVRATEAVLTARLGARVDGVPVSVEAGVDASRPVPALKLAGGATGVPIDQVAERLGRPDLSGVAGKLTFGFDAAGTDADALRAGFALTVTAAEVRVAERAPPRRELARLRTLRIDAGGDGESRARADGVLWGERFSLDAATTRLGALLGGTPSPVRLTAALGAARASAKGTLARGARGIEGRLDVDAGARPIGPLHNLLPVNPAAALDAAFAGAVQLDAGGTEIRAETLRVGSSAGRGKLYLPAGQAPPRVELALETLDAAELQRALRTPAAPRANAAAPPDAAFDLAARSVRYATHRFDDVRISGELRGGRIAAAPFSAGAGATRVGGTVTADLRQAERRFEIDAAASPVDLGAALAWAGAPGYAGSAERATLKARLRGATAAALARNAAGELALERAVLGLPAYFMPETIAFSATAQAAPGQPLTVALDGNAGATAITASLRLDDPAALFDDGSSAPFAVELHGAQSSLRLSGAWGSGQRGRLELAGRNPADLAPLLDLDPPDLGPYRVEADLVWGRRQLKSPRFALTLGESSATGEFGIDWRGRRPRVDLTLTSPRLRVEDIGVDDWLRKDPRPSAPDGPERARRLEAWRAYLRAYDGSVRVDARRVESGGELLGRGLYQERRENGRVSVSPLLMEAEGARLTVTGDVEAAGGDLRYALRARLENFDLGPLARSLSPDRRGFGTLDARADLTSRGLPEEFLANASGPVEVMFIGEDLGAGGFDLLSTSLLRIIGTALHGERGGRINCAVGDFTLTQGVLESRAFFIDTTRSRVAGDLRADLRTRELSGLLQPQAKRLQLFSAATPLTIGGTLENPQVAVSPVGIVTGTLRLYFYAPALALDWLNARGLPEDGTPDCREAFQKLAD